jgi:hypothetical protein
MRGHVIGALVGMNEVRCIFGNQMIEECMQVGPSTGIGILHEDETGTGVLNEDSHGAGCDPYLGNKVLDLTGDFIGSLSRRTD